MKLRNKKQGTIKKEKKEGEYLITYTRHLEKRLRNLETEKQLLDAERIRLKEELHSLRNVGGRNRIARVRKSPILRLMELVPANLRNVFGEILKSLMQIVLSTRYLGDQSLQDVKSKISNLLEEIKEIEKKFQEPSVRLLKWYELQSVKADQPPVSNNKIEKEEKKKYNYAFKIIVLGKPEKTAFIRRFITERFEEDIKMTIGVDFSIKNVEVEGKTVTLRIWDFAGEERFRVLLPSFVKGADGGIFMYDAIDAKTLSIISEVIEIVRNSAGDIPIFLTLAKLPSKEGQLAVLTKKYTLTDITSEVGSNGEQAFELLTKKMLEQEHIE